MEQREKQLSLFSGETINVDSAPSEKSLQIASLRAELLELYKSMEEIYKGQKREKLVSEFLEAFNGGSTPQFGYIQDQLGKISRATIYGWLQAYREGGIDALIPAAKPRKVTRAERRCLTEILMDPSTGSGRAAIKIGTAILITKYFLRRKGTPSPSSPATLRRWATKMARGRE